MPDNDDPSNGRTDTDTPTYSESSSVLLSQTQTTSITDNAEIFDDEDPQDEIDFLKAFFPNLWVRQMTPLTHQPAARPRPGTVIRANTRGCDRPPALR